jgi:hypothetical protein
MNHFFDYLRDNAPVFVISSGASAIIQARKQRTQNLLRVFFLFVISASIGTTVGYSLQGTDVREYSLAIGVCSALLGERIIPFILNNKYISSNNTDNSNSKPN